MGYLTQLEVDYILKKHYNNNIYHSKDTFIVSNNSNTKLTMLFTKYILLNYTWDIESLSKNVYEQLLKRKTVSCFIKTDIDLLLQEKDKNSFYIYRGHAGHLVFDPHSIVNNFTPLYVINYNSIKDFCNKNINMTIPKNMISSAHLIINKVLSYNISIII